MHIEAIGKPEFKKAISDNDGKSFHYNIEQKILSLEDKSDFAIIIVSVEKQYSSELKHFYLKYVSKLAVHDLENQGNAISDTNPCLISLSDVSKILEYAKKQMAAHISNDSGYRLLYTELLRWDVKADSSLMYQDYRENNFGLSDYP